MILGWKLTEPMRIKPCLFIPHLTHTKSTQLISYNYGGHDIFSTVYNGSYDCSNFVNNVG
jgi:hypothetical protein